MALKIKRSKFQLNPDSTYHAILIKKYGYDGALKAISNANTIYFGYDKLQRAINISNTKQRKAK